MSTGLVRIPAWIPEGESSGDKSVKVDIEDFCDEGTGAQPSSSKPTPLDEFYKGGRMVVPLTAPVKRFVNTYMGLFGSQKEAAEAAGVDLSTINNYATAYKNMALNVFDRMAEVLKSQMPSAKITKQLQGKKLESLRSLAKKQNGAWVDHVMYVINDGLLAILKVYTEPFRSREEAGLALGLNARTYTAYLKGQIQCFPRKHFWLIVDNLKERELTEADILELAGAEEWDDILVEKQRTSTLDLSQEEVLQRLTQAIMTGKLKKKELPPAFLNAINRTFGNFGEAVLAASGRIAGNASSDIEDALDRGNLAKVLSHMNRYGEYYKRCRRSLEFVKRARREEERGEIDSMLVKFQKRLSHLEKMSNRLAQVNNLILVGGVNGGFINGNNKTGENDLYQLAKEYSPDRVFLPGDLIYHGGLGLGEVLEIKEGSTILVKFEGSKQPEFELAQNRSSIYNR